MAQQAERFYTTNLTYVGFAANTAICEPKAIEFYNVAVGNLNAKTYTVTATPQGGHTDPTCGALGITQTGAKTPATAGCW